jgi:hypothetical protein
MKYGFLLLMLPLVIEAQNTGFVVDNQTGQIQVIDLAPAPGA